MDRREFFQTGLIAALASKVLGDATPARAQAPAAAVPQAGPPPASTAAPRKLIMDAYTRHLAFLRTPDEIAEAAIELTCGGVNPTIQAYPGHIDPAKVAEELPPFVKTMQKHGLRVKQVRGGNQTDVSAPNVEAMVGTMGQLGVTHYWIGTDNYDLTKPILPQLDAIKVKVEKFVKLNQKHGTTLMYHTRAGASSVGSVVWDLLYVMKDFDPKHVGFHWDTGHMSHHGSNMWELLMRTAGPYVVAVGWKDRTWQQELGFLGEGGPFPGPQPQPAAAGRGGGRGRGAAAGRGAGRGDAPGGEAPPAAGGPPAAAAGRGAGRAGGAPGAAGPPGAGRGDAGGPPAAGRGEAGGEGREGGPPAGRGGRGGRGGGNRAFPLPLAGNTFARGGGWTSPYVPMGTGLVDLFRYAVVLRDIGFDGPMELEAEYPNGGSQSGSDKLTLPREQVLGNLKRDILTIRAAFQQSETGLSI
jgi:sugar phosphate isomerase/epimerase